MFSYCTDPSTLESLAWLSCYLTTGKHFLFYWSFGTVLVLLAITLPTALFFGFGGATMARSHIPPVSWLGKGYIAIARGVPDIAFFLFFVIALDQALEYLRHRVKCPDWEEPVRQGNDFIVGVGTAATTAITSPTLGFGAGMIMYIVISTFAGKDSKKKVA